MFNLTLEPIKKNQFFKYLCSGIVDFIGSLGDLGHLIIGDSDQLVTNVLCPRPGGSAHRRNCEDSSIELLRPLRHLSFPQAAGKRS